MIKIIKLVIFCLMISNTSASREISCKENPGCKNYPQIIKFEGIKYPLTMVQKEQGKKPTSGTYYIFHFKPLKNKPSPYVVIIPTSGGITKAAAVTFERYKNKLLDNGFGVIILDQFYNTGIEKGTSSQGPLASMGALSIIEYIKQNHSNLSNNKFGIMGGSRGGMTVLSLASPLVRENFIYKNVKQWFDAGVAFYPSCGKQELTMPVVVFIGELDEWVSATNCKMWKKRDQKQISSGMLEIYIYKNAHHAFNRELIKELYRPTKDDHDLPGRAVQYNKKADKHSQKKMIEFFIKHLK